VAKVGKAICEQASLADRLLGRIDWCGSYLRD